MRSRLGAINFALLVGFLFLSLAGETTPFFWVGVGGTIVTGVLMWAFLIVWVVQWLTGDIRRGP